MTGRAEPGTAVDRMMAYLRGSPVLWECLERLAGLGLPDCCLGAGCVAQTVWNAAHDKPPDADISDFDVVYFDAAIGVRLVQGRPQVVAPYGIDDLLSLVVRASRVQITAEIYLRKVARWQRHWPDLTVLPWEAGRGEVGIRRI